jgi:hypothetical protein
MDTAAIVAAYEHGLVFTKADVDHLIATAKETKRMWSALAPYDVEIQQHYEATANPDDWGGLGISHYLMLQSKLAGE